ncbi:hypothetical protein Avi_6199 [Allorhizobium ampelinum S4]|uniref:Uncharacterized protein n=1 Tax=Allorhizobium ampelinum (strain ATCC BAA-846 / DSM 112012 / S4) TaxID=311402 RepID=B9K2T5_ALLAM|nr:hypothetical protein Avi_6199 [Allorhizobium ampelinum S4]
MCIDKPDIARFRHHAIHAAQQAKVTKHIGPKIQQRAAFFDQRHRPFLAFPARTLHRAAMHGFNPCRCKAGAITLAPLARCRAGRLDMRPQSIFDRAGHALMTS